MSPAAAIKNGGVKSSLAELQLAGIPKSRVAVFVGNAWDPSEESPSPWVDIARQLAGAAGVRALGPEAGTKAPGAARLQNLYEAPRGSVLSVGADFSVTVKTEVAQSLENEPQPR